VTGYCTHYSTLFPIWHRPYMALFEAISTCATPNHSKNFQQILAGHVQSIAKTYKSKPYQTAADHFRVPYWDWSSESSMPDIVNTPTVSITTPTGYANVSNPLLLYKFQQFPLNESWFPADYPGYGVLNTYPTTLRTPIDNASSPDSANANLGASGLKINTVSFLLSPGTLNEREVADGRIIVFCV
jgi:tyrosinase